MLLHCHLVANKKQTCRSYGVCFLQVSRRMPRLYNDNEQLTWNFKYSSKKWHCKLVTQKNVIEMYYVV